jgi:hypothetical protein
MTSLLPSSQQLSSGNAAALRQMEQGASQECVIRVCAGSSAGFAKKAL